MDITNSPFEKFLQVHIVERKTSSCKIGINYRKDLTNPHGIYHGGLISSITDTLVSSRSLRVASPALFILPNLQLIIKTQAKRPSFLQKAARDN